MISIRPFSRCYQGEESLDIFFSEEQRVAFLFSFTLELLRVVITFKTWVKSNFWIQHLREGQNSWSQVSWQVFALHSPSATLPLSYLFLSHPSLSHCPSPASSDPVCTILNRSTQQTGHPANRKSLHNYYLKHINSNIWYFII